MVCFHLYIFILAPKWWIKQIWLFLKDLFVITVCRTSLMTFVAVGKKTWSFWTRGCAAFWRGNFGLSNQTIWNRPQVVSFRWFGVRPAFFSHFLLLTSPFSVLLFHLVFPSCLSLPKAICATQLFQPSVCFINLHFFTLLSSPPCLRPCSWELRSVMTSHLNSLIITRQTCTETQKDNHKGQRFGSVWTNVPSHEWAVCSWFGVIKLYAGYVHQCFYMSKHQSLCRWWIRRRQPLKKDIVLLKGLESLSLITFISNVSKYWKDLILPLLPSSTTCVAAIRIKMSLFVCLLCSTVNKIRVSMIYRSLTSIFYLHFTHQPNILEVRLCLQHMLLRVFSGEAIKSINSTQKCLYVFSFQKPSSKTKQPMTLWAIQHILIHSMKYSFQLVNFGHSKCKK